jgi:hypothetical protein
MFETTSNVWNFVIGAYGISWLVLVGYSIRLMIVNRRAAAALSEGEQA